MKRVFNRCFVVLCMPAVLSMALLAAQAPGDTKTGGTKKATAAVANRCIAKTADGDQRKRKAQAGKQYCWQHDPTRKSKTSGKKK